MAARLSATGVHTDVAQRQVLRRGFEAATHRWGKTNKAISPIASRLYNP